MQKSMKFAFPFVLVVFACCILASGCQKKASLKGLYPVKGKITLDGAPLDGASIILAPKAAMTGDVRACGATSDKNGEFKLRTLEPDDGAFPGEYTITVKKMVPDKVYTEEEYAAANAKGESLEINAANVLPEMYAKPQTSGLTFTVKAGKNDDLIIELNN